MKCHDNKTIDVGKEEEQFHSYHWNLSSEITLVILGPSFHWYPRFMTWRFLLVVEDIQKVLRVRTSGEVNCDFFAVPNSMSFNFFAECRLTRTQIIPKYSMEKGKFYVPTTGFSKSKSILIWRR